jgi:hypothetical protein
LTEGHGRIGLPSSAVKVPAALLLVLLAVGVPRLGAGPDPSFWDVLVVVVESVDVTAPSTSGRTRLRFETTEEDIARVRREVAAFVRRVEKGTAGRLRVRSRIVVVRGPLTTLSGPGPYWLSPSDVSPFLTGPAAVGTADTVLTFAKIGEDAGPAVTVRQFGGAVGGDPGPGGACFAAVTYRPRWLDGSGTAPLHEWLHGLDWALTEVSGFPDDAVPDPDEGRRGPTCCADAPRGDSAYADHVLARHVTPAMLRAADARRGPAVEDGYLRRWRIGTRPRPESWRTVTLDRSARAAHATLPAGTRLLDIVTSGPVRVRLDDGPATMVSRRGRLPARGRRVAVERAVGGAEIRFRVRATAP